MYCENQQYTALFLVSMRIWAKRNICYTIAGGFFQYKIGFLFPWLTVYSNTGDRRSTFDLLFSGNEGVYMNLLGLVLYVILVLLIGLLVQMLYDRVGRRNPQAGKDRKAPSNI